MTVWVNGNVPPVTWFNSLEQVLALGTYGPTTSPRLTMAPNTTFDIAGAVASTLALNGSVTVGANQYFRGIEWRSLTSTVNAGAGTPDAACFAFDHTTNVAAGSGAYGMIGTMTGSAGAGTIRAIYARTGISSTFAGAFSAVTAAVSMHIAPVGVASVIDIAVDSDGAFSMPLGISFGSNTPGVGSLATAIVVTNTLTIGGVVLEWVQRTGNSSSSQRFLDLVNPLGVETFFVDGLGNLNFAATGVTTGQRITGDFANTTNSLRTLFASGSAAGNTVLGAVPTGANVTAGFRFYNTNNPDAAGYVAIQINGTTAFINSTNLAGTTMPLELQMNTVQMMAIKINTDITIGKVGAGVADTTGHMYIQAVAGAVTGVPTTYAGFVPMRYDSTNNFLYIYNGGWKKSTVYA